MSYLEQLRANLRFEDSLDVLLVAILVYGAITWIRRSRSRFVMVGVAVLAGLYFVARALTLHLTLAVFHGAVTVALLAVVVIFQEDLRRAFERIAVTRGPLRRASRGAGSLVVDTVVEAVRTMAEGRTGALLVFKGKEPLDRHITGGVPLHGTISPQLLYSIFDTSSPGHDGAVLVVEGMASRFGVHLPLSTALRGGERFGTRHTAALGLAERSDALVVVVSEERGEISVARDGALEVVTPAELRKKLAAFLAGLGGAKTKGWLRRALTESLGTKALSVALAVAAWIVVVGQESQVVSRTFDVPVVLAGVREGWYMEEPRPGSTRVTVSGPSRAFRGVDETDLAIRLDVSDAASGSQRMAVRHADVQVPAGLQVTGVEPRFVTVVAHETVTRELPVKVATRGRPPRPYRVRSIRVEPSTIPVVVRREDASRITEVPTDTVDLTSLREPTTLTSRVVVPRGADLAPSTPTEVQVTVDVGRPGSPPPEAN